MQTPRWRGLSVPCLVVAALLGGPGCEQEPCARFELLEGRAGLPANVSMFFHLETCDGEPIPDLESHEFIVRENGEEISLWESRPQILPQPQGFALVSVLLLDLSHSVIGSGNLVPLQGAARIFVDRIAGSHEVAIFLFDGRADLQPLVDFTTDTQTLRAGIDSLSGYEPVDPSTNLNGAVVSGLAILSERAARLTAPLTAGSLIVFTDGSDQAARVSRAEALRAVESSSQSVLTIGLGGEIDEEYLREIGRDGHEFASDGAEIGRAFERIAARIERMSRSYYRLGYCSPKRAGFHSLTIELRGSAGSLEYDFRADGFQPGCNDENLADPGGGDDASSDRHGEWVELRPGPFSMGSPATEPGRRDDEAQHLVTLTHDFEILSTEVTQEEFGAVMGFNPSEFSRCGPSCPVETVSWGEAAAYCNGLSEAAGLATCYHCQNVPGDGLSCAPNPGYPSPYLCPGYRIPTEAEWEYAARAGTTTSTHAGDAALPLDDVCRANQTLDRIAWWCGNSSRMTNIVGLLEPNAYGLHDMLGNVAEWTNDWYAAYGTGGPSDPWVPEISDSFAVVRGGSCDNGPQDVRSAARLYCPASRCLKVGLRPVRTTRLGGSGGSD